jgi:DNA-binding response OmpR family regulator
LILKANILLVEDEPFLAKVIKDSLEQLDYTVVHAADGKKAYSLFLNQHFNLCILDVMLPGTDGFTLAKQIRGFGAQLPLLFLTARTATKDIIEGYDSGGNDYLKKPFSLEELFLRVNELLKRNPGSLPQTKPLFNIGQYQFVPYKQVLQFKDEKEIRLSHRETQLLQMLYDHKNVLLERKHVLMTLWGDDSFFNTRTMDVFITKLRKHLKNDPAIEIINIRGIGYKMIC